MTANCYGGFHMGCMLKLYSKCYKNVPAGSRSNPCCWYILNVPNLLLMIKWWVYLTRALNVLNM